jgi:hypothetical protein
MPLTREQKMGLALAGALGLLVLINTLRYGEGRKLHKLRREVEDLARRKP